MHASASTNCCSLQLFEQHKKVCIGFVETLACALLVIGILGLIASQSGSIPGLNALGVGSSSAFVSVGFLIALTPLIFLCKSCKRTNETKPEKPEIVLPPLIQTTEWEKKAFEHNPSLEFIGREEFKDIDFVRIESSPFDHWGFGSEYDGYPLYLGYPPRNHVLSEAHTVMIVTGRDEKRYAVLATMAWTTEKKVEGSSNITWVALSEPKELPSYYKIEDLRTLFPEDRNLSAWWSADLEKGWGGNLIWQNPKPLVEIFPEAVDRVGSPTQDTWTSATLNRSNGNIYFKAEDKTHLYLAIPKGSVLTGEVVERYISGTFKDIYSVNTQLAYHPDSNKSIWVILDHPVPHHLGERGW